nr:hypothetical protein [Tanacetum cinerariifolium]
MVSTKKAYSRLLVDISCKFGTSSFRGLKDSDPVIMSPANSSSSIRSLSSSPFNGLVICVTGLSKDELASGNSCLPVAMLENAKQPNMIQKSRIFSSEEELKRRGSVFSGQSFYVDTEVSAKSCRIRGGATYEPPVARANTVVGDEVVEAAFGQGGSLVDQWLPGHNAGHVVCEDSSVQKYLGHSSYLVTPLWVLKTVKETRPQRLVHLSADLARQIGIYRRGRRLQACQAPIKPLTPPTLLDSVCWSQSEPSSSASIYTDSEEAKTSINEDGKESDASFVNSSRPLSEVEKNELVFKNHFLTILFQWTDFQRWDPLQRRFSVVHMFAIVGQHLCILPAVSDNF